MKFIRVLLDPIKLKGDPDDYEQLQADLYEKVQALLDTESLGFTIDDDSLDEDED